MSAADGELTFADHAGRFCARRYGMAPRVGRLVGYLAVCEPPEQSVSELGDPAARASVGMLALFGLALIWLAVVLGLAAKSVEIPSNTPMYLILLPFLGSGFARTATMPVRLRQFAEYEPFSPVVGTVRGLLTDAAIGNRAVVAVAWSIGVPAVSYLWATRLYERCHAANPV